MNRITANFSAWRSPVSDDGEARVATSIVTPAEYTDLPDAIAIAIAIAPARDKPASLGDAPGNVAILDALGIAALICGASSQVTFATIAARRLLASGDAIRLASQPNGGGILVTSDRQTTIRLGRSISMAASGIATAQADGGSGCTLAVSRRSDAAPLVLAIAPFAPSHESAQVLIIASDPDAEDEEFARRIRSAFGLTRAETRLAVALARGVCRKEFARCVGVQASTVKTQITNLFVKTGVRRESDLVRILTAVPRLAWPGR